MPRWYQRFSHGVMPLQIARALPIAFSSASTNGWSPRWISVTPAAFSRPSSSAKPALVAASTSGQPALGLQHDQPVGPDRGWQRVGPHQAERPAIAAAALGDLDRHLPHVFEAVGVRAVRALAGRQPLAAIDAPLRRLEREVAAIGGRPDDRAADLRADRRRHHVGADRRRRARRRAAGRALGIERIGRGAGLRAAELGSHRLGEDHRACLAQRPHRGIVALGEVPLHRLAAHLGGHVLRLEQVLDRDRHAVDQRQRLAGLPALGAGVGGGAGAGLVQRGEGLHHRLARGDGLEAALEIGARAVVAVGEAPGGVVERQRLVVGVCGHVW
jgi:hypothetical protein